MLLESSEREPVPRQCASAAESGTRTMDLLARLCFPNPVSEGAAMYHELRKRGTGLPQRAANPIAGVPCFVHDET
ncbi:MAG: hypothetical protein ACJ8E1_10900 [Xanthobacteraceae bacterium]